MTIDVKLPEIGDGIESGDVMEVLVHEGQVIDKDQDILELETDKATMGVPSTHAGKVIKIHVKEGDTIPIGATLISLETVDASLESAGSKPLPTTESPQQRESPGTAAREAESTSVAEGKSEITKGTRSSTAKEHPHTELAQAQPSTAVSGEVAAGPSIRRFAREVGVDLSNVKGSGPNGRITRDDVLAVVRTGRATPEGRTALEASQRDAWGPIHTEPMSKIRKTIAVKMHDSWSTVPRVTNFDDADVTELEDFRRSSKEDYAKKGIKLTSMPFVIKAVAMALKSHPTINASLDAAKHLIVYKNYVNIGIAVDTERGLVVPSLRGADDLSIAEIAQGLAKLADQARRGDFSIDDLRGGTFTISNLGAIGGTYSTPIVNIPEVAVLLIGRSRKLPVVKNDQIVSRLMMPLSLSYDHRLVDGAAAARFLNDVIEYLKAPSRLLLAP